MTMTAKIIDISTPTSTPEPKFKPWNTWHPVVSVDYVQQLVRADHSRAGKLGVARRRARMWHVKQETVSR